MQESLLNLFKLQSIDNQLYELEQLKRNIPKQIDALDRQYEDTGNTLTEKQEELEALQKDHRQHERDLSAAQDQIRKYQGQLHDVKTNKEYDALQTQIQVQKGVISQHEEAILELMSSAEELSQAIETLKTEVAAQQERIGEERDSLEKQLQATGEDIQIKMDERRRMELRIDSRVLSVYNRIRRGRNREAVVRVKKGACGGCFYKIPLQKIAEIRRFNRIITCEGCGRILFMEPEAPQA